jgi:hypothetical protein
VPTSLSRCPASRAARMRKFLAVCTGTVLMWWAALNRLRQGRVLQGRKRITVRVQLRPTSCYLLEPRVKRMHNLASTSWLLREPNSDGAANAATSRPAGEYTAALHNGKKGLEGRLRSSGAMRKMMLARSCSVLLNNQHHLATCTVQQIHTRWINQCKNSAASQPYRNLSAKDDY